jgi:GMP synthase (glutamine-hydrolysing)
MRPWLVVDAYVEDPEGGAVNFLPHLTDREVVTTRPAWGGALERADRFGGVVITGSAAGVNDGLPWVAELVDFIRGAVRDGVPVLGVCFGHQVLAEAVLGPGAIRAAPRPEVGWFEITHSGSSPLLAGTPETFTTFLSHGDEVIPERAGPLEVFARSERCAVQGYRVPDRRAWGVQFHAEMSLAEATELVQRKIGVSLPGDPVEAMSLAVDSRPLIARLMRAFVSQAG